MALETKDTKKFISVLGSTGDFRMSVPEGTEGAVRREYESSDGKTGVKFEHVFKSVGGKIVGAEFFEGDYGKNLILTFDFEDGTENIAVSLGTNSPYGEDVMKKLPNIDMNEHVVFSPYAFEDEKGKTRKGISITQGDEKIKNAFYDGEKNLLDYPEVEGENLDKDDWKIYFTQCRKFLVGYVEDNILPQFTSEASGKAVDPDEEF